MKYSKITDNEAITLFKQIIQYDTISELGPVNGSYDSCAEWLLRLCSDIHINAWVLPESRPHKPIVVAEW